MRFQSRRVQYLVDDSKPHPNFNARRDNGFIRAAIFFERVSGFMHFAIMVALVVAVSRFATRLPELRIARVAFAVACALHEAAQKILAWSVAIYPLVALQFCLDFAPQFARYDGRNANGHLFAWVALYSLEFDVSRAASCRRNAPHGVVMDFAVIRSVSENEMYCASAPPPSAQWKRLTNLHLSR